MDVAGKIPRLVPVEIRPGVVVCGDAAGVAREAAARFVQLSRQFVTNEGFFSVALAGGKTPRELYRVLASDEFWPQADWGKVHLFWGDERAVPPDHPDSNYGMVCRELLARVPIPPENIHRMEAERPDAEQAAGEYEAVLRRYLQTDSQGFPRFHLILLGMGADGHTASLFAGSPALAEMSRWVSAQFVEKLGSRRMTLTLPVLNAADNVIFLVTGAEKAETLERVIEGTSQPRLPAQRVQPAGQRLFLVDTAAAGAVLNKKTP